VIPEDRAKFLDVVLGFAELKGKKLSAPALELYWRAMQDWEIHDFLAAAERLVSTSQYMPEPYHFDQLRKAGLETAPEAWARAVRHAASSAYRRGPIGDPLIDKCVEIVGGYAAIALSDVSKLQFIERRFCEHYATIGDAQETRDAVPQIAYQHPPLLLAGVLKRIGH
jgi:hypothetical protein